MVGFTAVALRAISVAPGNTPFNVLAVVVVLFVPALMKPSEVASGWVGQSNRLELNTGAGLVLAADAATQTFEPVKTPFTNRPEPPGVPPVVFRLMP